jgi:dipeptidyl aminopeptidase/acylaminoacyl peptidase
MSAATLLLALAIAAAPPARTGAHPVTHPTAPVRADSLAARDLLDVMNASVTDLSDDGRWIALAMSRRRDGLGVVAARDGDPSYLRITPIELLYIDTRTLERKPVFAGKRPVRGATWSPDGSSLAYLEIVNDRLRIVVWNRSTGRSVTSRLPEGRYVAENSELRWNGDGTQLYFAQRTEAWRTKVQARFAELVKGPITHLGSPKREPFLPWEALRREGSIRAIASWTPASNAVTTLIPEGNIGNWEVSPDGQVRVWNEDRGERTDYTTIMGRVDRAVARVGSDTTTRVLFPRTQGVTIQWTDSMQRYFFAREGAVWMGRLGASASDTAGLRRRLLAPDSIPASDTSATARARRAATRWALVRTAPNGSAIIVSKQDGLYLADTNGISTRIVALPDSTDLASPRATVLEWSQDGRYVYLAMNARDRYDRAVNRWDRQTGQLTTLARDTQFRSGLRLSRDANTIVFNLASSNRPADPHIADGALANVRRVTEANPQLTADRLAKTELIRYLDADGKPQWGVLYHPTNGAKPAPTIFLVYEDFFDDTFDATANLLASRGYAVLKPSVAFETGYPGEAWLKGVTAAANHLIAAGVADSARLGVHGTSYGGYATNLLITQTKRFKAAINISGKVDFISFYTDSPRLGDRNTHAAERSQDRIGATMWEAPMKYIEHSAVMYADRITTPVLLMTGGEDHNVPALNTREMYYALRRLNKEVEWVNYAEGGHGIPMTNEREFTHFHDTLLSWYDRWLKSTKPAATMQ